jgi:c-di-GMP-binding flagellar brake protein YcgR
MTSPERRKHPRIPRQYVAQINVHSGENPTNWETVTVLNLSAGGMLFSYRTYLKLGTLVKARIDFPPAGRPVEVTGRVVRQDTSEAVRLTAVFFTEIDARQQALIDECARQWFPSG